MIKAFQCTATVSWNHGKKLQIISNIKPLINNHNWKGMNQPSVKDDWKRFEKNNPTIVLNVLYVKKWIYICLVFKI